MLRIWGRGISINVQKVLWLAGELGVEFEHVPAGGDFGRLDEPEFRALNPFGKVPAIDDDGVAVWESHAILRYLAERYGADRFWPDLVARTRIEPWLDWHQTTFQPPFAGGLLWGYFRTPEAQRNWPAIGRSEATCAELLRFVDRELADRPYLAGNELTLADIPLGACLYRYFEMDVMHPEAPNVARWYARLCERPAYRQHVMQPFEDLRGRLAF
jgi:glutathione S-transferase